jgi:hypothetical protein
MRNYFVEPMGDIQDADAALAQVAEHGEEVIDIAGGQGGRRLVEHERTSPRTVRALAMATIAF